MNFIVNVSQLFFNRLQNICRNLQKTSPFFVPSVSTDHRINRELGFIPPIKITAPHQQIILLIEEVSA